MKALELCDKVIVLSEEVGMYCYDCGCKDYEIEAPKLAHALKAAILTLQGYKVNGDSVETLPKAPIELIGVREALGEIDRIANE